MLFHAAILSIALQAPATDDPDVVFPTTRLSIDASAVADGGSEDPALWEGIITKIVTEEFRVYHIPVITLDEQATFEAKVSWASGPESTDVHIEVVIRKHGEDPQTRSFVCEDCEFASGTAQRIVEELPTLLPLLELPPPDPEPQGPPSPPDRPKPKPRKLAGLGWAGVATTALGAGLVGGGAFMLTREDTDEGTDSTGRFTLTETHPLRTPGIALAAVGGAAIAGGIAMIVLDVRRQKKKNAEQTKPTAALAPLLHTPGFVLTGRF